MCVHTHSHMHAHIQTHTHVHTHTHMHARIYTHAHSHTASSTASPRHPRTNRWQTSTNPDPHPTPPSHVPTASPHHWTGGGQTSNVPPSGSWGPAPKPAATADIPTNARLWSDAATTSGIRRCPPTVNKPPVAAAHYADAASPCAAAVHSQTKREEGDLYHQPRHGR